MLFYVVSCYVVLRQLCKIFIETDWLIYASTNEGINVSDNGLSPIRRQAIT